jgi:hypothetical protein
MGKTRSKDVHLDGLFCRSSIRWPYILVTCSSRNDIVLAADVTLVRGGHQMGEYLRAGLHDTPRRYWESDRSPSAAKTTPQKSCEHPIAWSDQIGRDHQRIVRRRGVVIVAYPSVPRYCLWPSPPPATTTAMTACQACYTHWQWGFFNSVTKRKIAARDARGLAWQEWRFLTRCRSLM